MTPLAVGLIIAGIAVAPVAVLMRRLRPRGVTLTRAGEDALNRHHAANRHAAELALTVDAQHAASDPRFPRFSTHDGRHWRRDPDDRCMMPNSLRDD